MHGRPRKPVKPEEAAASAAKAEKLRALQAQFLSNHHHKIYTKEAVELSAKLVEINPEAYTAWSYRKLAVEYNLSQSESDAELVKSILDEELRVVENALRQNFKSYGAWHHRKWVLSKGHSNIDKELRLLEKLQTVDPRNFHAWNYRRFVTALLNRSNEDELKYTRNLIDNNISNYSAWHNRSVLLSSLMKNKVQGFADKHEVLTREYELVREALFTDEDDQSGWFYHLWLLDQTVKAEHPFLVSSWPARGSDLYLLEDKCLVDKTSSPFHTLQSDSGSFPLVLYFNQTVEGVNSSTVKVGCGFSVNNVLNWKPLSSTNACSSQVWFAQLKHADDVKNQTLEAYPVNVTVGHSRGIISFDGIHFSHPSQFSFTVHIKLCQRKPGEGCISQNISWQDEKYSAYEPSCSHLVVPLDHLDIKNEEEPSVSSWQSKIIDEEIEHFQDLLDSKIGKLTLARLLTARDELMPSNKSLHSEEVLGLFSELMKLDPSHSRYYKDEYSLALLKQETSCTEMLQKHLFLHGDLASQSSDMPICLRLDKLSLSRMGSFERLLWVQMLDLSHNELQSIEGLEAMQLLSYLRLSNNKLGSFTALEPLRHLQLLKVLDISHNEIGARSIDTTRYLCSSPLSHSVGSGWNSNETVIDGLCVTNYWEAYLVLKGLNLIQLDVVGNAIADEKFRHFLVKVLPKLEWLDGEQLK